MKILIVSDLFLPHVGGVFRHIQKISREHIKNGHKVALLVPSEKFLPYTKIVDGVVVYGLSSIPFPSYPDMHLTLPYQNKNILRVMNQFQPDIIHVHTNLTLAFMASKVAKKLKIPLVGTNHFMSENLLPKINLPIFVKKFAEKKFWTILKIMFSRFDYIVAPTVWGVNYLKEKGIENNFLALSNGIDLHFFKKDRALYRKVIINKYHLPDSGTTLLYLGRIDREKNIEILLRCMRILNRDDINLILVGKGAAFNELKQLTKKLKIEDRVYFTGFVEDKYLSAFHQLADIFVISSKAELQSIATMEAMASGLPILASKAGALPELVHNNINGLLFKADDPYDLKVKLLKMISNKDFLTKMGSESKRIVNKHDIRNVAVDFEKFYEELLKRYHIQN